MTLSRHNIHNADGSINQAATRRLFRMLRDENGLSVRLVARRLGVSKSYLYQLETGRCRWHEQLVEDAWQAMEELMDRSKRTRLSLSEYRLIWKLYEEGVGPTRIAYETGIELKTIKGVIYFGRYKKWQGV